MLTVQTTRDARTSVTRCNFADMADLLTGAHVAPANRFKLSDKLDSINGDGWSPPDWYGGIVGVDAATALVRDGWKDGAQRASSLAPKLSNVVTPVKSVRRRVAWSEDGTELHLDRALRGDWDRAFRTSVHTAAGLPKVLSLGCNFGGNACITHEQLFWCAAQMIVATDLLENAGYAVELHALKCNDIGAGKRVYIDVLVKQPDQPMRPDAVASMFGHAGVYRSFGHVLLMSSPFDIGAGYGNPTNVTAAARETAAEGLTDALDYVLEQAYSLEQAARNVTKALTTLTGPAANE